MRGVTLARFSRYLTVWSSNIATPTAALRLTFPYHAQRIRFINWRRHSLSKRDSSVHSRHAPHSFNWIIERVMLGSASCDGGHGTAHSGGGGEGGGVFLQIKHRLQEHTERRTSWRSSPSHIYLGLLGDGHIVGPWGIGDRGKRQQTKIKKINKTTKQMGTNRWEDTQMKHQTLRGYGMIG